MSTFPANIARVPTLLSSSLSLSNLTRTNLSLFEVEAQLATGRRVLRPSDDAVSASLIGLLDQRIEEREQTLRNLTHADSALVVLDDALGEANDLVLEAKTLASSQLNIGTDAEERAGQAIVIESLIRQLEGIANRDSVVGSIFGGSRTSGLPIESFRGGYRYTGEGPGLFTDIGLGVSTPVTMPAGGVLGSTSTRVVGTTEMIPALTDDTRLVDLMGARGLGVNLGEIEFSFDNGPLARIDLTQADTVQDVADAVADALTEYESANGVTILGPGGVGFAGQTLTVDVAPGPPDPPLEFRDVGSGTTALDLGLHDGLGSVFDAANAAGQDLRPKLVPTSPIGTLFDPAGLGQIQITNMARSQIVDLSGAQTFQDIVNAIESTDLGVRVELDPVERRLIVVNEVSGGTAQAMSIEEVTGQNGTAEMLGIRTMMGTTRLEDFNDGRGVRVLSGGADPTTGLPDPALDVDFVITLGDAAQTPITVNLRPEDATTVQAVLDRINAEAAPQLAAAGLAPTDFQAVLLDGDNGIAFVQNPAFAGAVRVEPDNNSSAAWDLGLMDATYDAATSTLLSEDRSAVRVDSLFTTLIDLRDALDNDDSTGITLAGEKLEEFVDRLAQERALVGGYSRRVDSARAFEEDRSVFDETSRSQLRDLDYAEAATRYSLLQTQLQAGLTVTGSSAQLSLLDFLG